MWDIGGFKRHGQVADEGRKQVTISNEKGGREGGVIPNTWNKRSLANCLDLRGRIPGPKTSTLKPKA